MVTRYTKTLEQIARPFVETGIYESRDAFVEDLVRDLIAGKVSLYRKNIKAYESKHGSFQKFTRKLGHGASPRQEDQWMEWEGARNMLKAWKRVARELGSSAS